MDSTEEAEEWTGEEARWAALGRHLRALREGHRWHQETLADEADVSVATIRAIENHQAGRRHTRRILEKLSRALGEPEDYLGAYLRNPPPDDSGGGPEITRTTPPHSPLDLVAPRLDEIVMARLHEIVVPRLEKVEGEVRALRDVISNTARVAEQRQDPDVGACRLG